MKGNFLNKGTDKLSADNPAELERLDKFKSKLIERWVSLHQQQPRSESEKRKAQNQEGKPIKLKPKIDTKSQQLIAFV